LSRYQAREKGSIGRDSQKEVEAVCCDKEQALIVSGTFSVIPNAVIQLIIFSGDAGSSPQDILHTMWAMLWIKQTRLHE
jgi:hypothetical protein